MPHHDFYTNSMLKITYHQSFDGVVYISSGCLKSIEYFHKGQFRDRNHRFLYKCNNVLLYNLQVCRIKFNTYMQHSGRLHKHNSDPLSIRICSHVNGIDIALLFLSLCVRGYCRCFPDPLVYLSQVKMNSDPLSSLYALS